MHTWSRFRRVYSGIFLDQHTLQAEAHGAPRNKKTSSPPIKEIFCMTNGTKQLSTAIYWVEWTQEYGTWRTQQDPYSWCSQHLGKKFLPARREIPTRKHAICLSTWKLQSKSTNQEHLLKSTIMGQMTNVLVMVGNIREDNPPHKPTRKKIHADHPSDFSTV